MVLEGLGKSLNSALKKLFGANVIDEELVKELVKDIQRALLVADVDVTLVMAMTQRVEKEALDETHPLSDTTPFGDGTAGKQIVDILMT